MGHSFFAKIIRKRQPDWSFYMPKTICLFNHKGGVSKTTTTFNLGWSLATEGKKVLIVDLDSQCNLTGLVLGFDAATEESMERFYSSRDNLTMKPVVDALINGTSPDEFIRSENGKLCKTGNENLLLLPGHLNVSELDSQISVALKIASGIPATRNIPGNLPKILQNIAEKNGVDYVIYDLSPTVGGLNEVALMASDYFIVPTSPDYFCYQAVGSLELNITRWHKEIARFIEDNGFDAKTYSVRNRPQFLGAIQQRYRPRYEKPATSFQKWIDIIRGTINDRLVPALAKINCTKDRKSIDAVLQGTELQAYDLANIPDFNSLIAISQQHSKPIFALTDEEIANTGNVFGHAKKTMIASRDNFLSIFNELANRIIILTS